MSSAKVTAHSAEAGGYLSPVQLPRFWLYDASLRCPQHLGTYDNMAFNLCQEYIILLDQCSTNYGLQPIGEL